MESLVSFRGSDASNTAACCLFNSMVDSRSPRCFAIVIQPFKPVLCWDSQQWMIIFIFRRHLCILWGTRLHCSRVTGHLLPKRAAVNHVRWTGKERTCFVFDCNETAVTMVVRQTSPGEIMDIFTETNPVVRLAKRRAKQCAPFDLHRLCHPWSCIHRRLDQCSEKSDQRLEDWCVEGPPTNPIQQCWCAPTRTPRMCTPTHVTYLLISIPLRDLSVDPPTT